MELIFCICGPKGLAIGKFWIFITVLLSAILGVLGVRVVLSCSVSCSHDVVV